MTFAEGVVARVTHCDHFLLQRGYQSKRGLINGLLNEFLNERWYV
jgi:hypothetical protein